MKRILEKITDWLTALKEDFLQSFSLGGRRVEYPYPESNTKVEVSKMAERPNKLRPWWRRIAVWLGIIDLDEVDDQPATSEPLPAQPLEPSRSPRRKQLLKQKRRESRSKWRKPLLWTCAILVVIAAAIFAATLIPIGNDGGNAVADTTSSPSTMASPVSPSPSAVDDGTTWQMVKGNYANNRWFGEGIAAIRHAKTKAQAEEAAYIWMDKVKRDPILLIGAAKYFFPNKKITKAQLVDEEGHATDKAVQLTAQLQIALAQSRISPALAPKNGTNSGVAGGQVVGATYGGITGDRTAILIVLPSGKKIWVMARCGNPVVMGPPPVPRGPTDQPLAPKKAGEDPYSQGNAPTGGGPNDNKGPGDYTEPGDTTKPPETPYTPPPAPQPTTPPSGGGGQTATPDPQPTPPNEGGDNDGTV